MHGGKSTRGGTRRHAIGEGIALPNGGISTRPQGGAVTEWYKGKTHLPAWRQISVEICRYQHRAFRNDTGRLNVRGLRSPHVVAPSSESSLQTDRISNV